MNILFLAPRLPVPVDTGAKIRTFNILKSVSRNNKVSLVAFDFGVNNDHFAALEGLGVSICKVPGSDSFKPISFLSRTPISIAKYASLLMAEKIEEFLLKGNFDLVHCDHLHMGQYRHKFGKVPCVLDEHNVESIILSRCAQIECNLVKKLVYVDQARKMRIIEAAVTRQFNMVLAVSQQDKEGILNLGPHNVKCEVVPNGVDLEYFHPREQNEEDAVVFTGSMDWLPNSEAVNYFIKDVLPLIWDQRPEVRFYVVGRNPPVEFRHFSDRDKRIVVTGRVDDVRPYVAKSKIFVVPLRVGGGTRLKILEAMAMGKAVVSTNVGAEGIKHTVNQNIILADNPIDFSKSVLELFSNKAKRDRMGVSGRVLVESMYGWDAIGDNLCNIYRGLLREK